MKKKTAVLILVGLFAGALDLHAGTGWNTNDGGSLQFLDSANWNEGDINGIFPAGWAPTAALSLRLTNDWTGTLTFLGSIAKDTTFYGRKNDDSGTQNRTITLDGDMLIQPSDSAGKLVVDATVGFDLGGETRVFRLCSPSSADKFRVNGPIANGDLVLAGNGAGMTLVANAAIGGNVTVRPNTTLAVNWATSTAAVRRAEDVELHRATFSVSAYQRDNTFEIGVLRTSGADAAGASIVAIADNNHVATLSADALEISDGGTLMAMAGNLGAAEAPSSRLVFKEAPALVGGILPSVFASTATTASGYGSGYGALRFTTYDSERGLRALGADEMATAISESEEVNLYVKSTTVSIESDATVNAVCLDATAWADAAAISGNAKLHVRSGQILASSSNGGMSIAAPIDFGNVRGSVTAMGWHHRAVNITKPFSGTAGLVLTKAIPMSFDLTQGQNSSAAGFAISGVDISDEGAYTGDTWIQCIVNVNSTPFLPHGSRSGNTIVNGCLAFGAISINGLYGSGAVRGTTLTVGEDGSDSRFAGSAYLTSSLNITNSTFVLDGSVTQGAVNVAAGAAIGGSGGITNNLVFASGAKLAVTVVDGVATCLAVAGEVSGGPVTVNANVRSGKWRTAQRILTSRTSMGEMTFVKGAGVGALELRENGTELWATPRKAGFYVVIQ